MRMDIDITGRSAHAGMEPEKGISSIKAASHAISMLREGWIDEETTVNVGIINGGQILNAVPEKTNIKVECRSKSHEKCLYQSEVIREAFITAAKASGARADVTMELGTTSYRIPEDAGVVEIAKKAVRSVGIEPNVRIVCGGSDATSYNEILIETIVIGAGYRAEHTKDEHIAVEDMEKAVAIIQHIFKELSEKGVATQ